ncbi:hypothetical protein TKK_0001652 [Trichogramma kaykai]
MASMLLPSRLADSTRRSCTDLHTPTSKDKRTEEDDIEKIQTASKTNQRLKELLKEQDELLRKFQQNRKDIEKQETMPAQPSPISLASGGQPPGPPLVCAVRTVDPPPATIVQPLGPPPAPIVQQVGPPPAPIVQQVGPPAAPIIQLGPPPATVVHLGQTMGLGAAFQPPYAASTGPMFVPYLDVPYGTYPYPPPSYHPCNNYRGYNNYRGNYYNYDHGKNYRGGYKGKYRY